MDDKEEIDLADITIGSNEYWNDMITVTGGNPTDEYDDWIQKYVDLEIDYNSYNPLGADEINLTAAGEEMLRVAKDGFYVRGVKVEADAKEAKAVYNAFKQWMTYAILNGEINN
jgi:hypothetical protein